MLDKEAAISSSILIRLGGVAAMVGGTLYVLAELLDLQVGDSWSNYYGFLPGGRSLFFNALLVGAMAATLAIAALYALRRDDYGPSGIGTSLLSFVGMALMLVGELGDPVAAVFGTALGSVGALALGLVTLKLRALPWWCGVALMVWGPALLFWLLLPNVVGLASPLPVSWGWPLAGVPWIVVGFAVFRTAGRRSEQPPRVR